MNIKESFDIYFDLIEDPRNQAHRTYQLSDILFLLIVGMLCNCTDLEMIIEFAEEKEELDVRDAVSTMDAMHCQKETAEKLLTYTRKHWQVESFHWLLDMNFRL